MLDLRLCTRAEKLEKLRAEFARLKAIKAKAQKGLERSRSQSVFEFVALDRWKENNKREGHLRRIEKELGEIMLQANTEGVSLFL
jgi:hypothetical protein